MGRPQLSQVHTDCASATFSIVKRRVSPDNSSTDNGSLECRAGALFNAVKRQYGSDTYLLNLRLPKPSPPPITVPAVLPRLPPPPLPDSPPTKLKSPAISEDPNQAVVNSLRLEEGDIQQLAKFVREFVVMSLVIWMEKCVTEWNEAVRPPC